jgi:hypothetical protein
MATVLAALGTIAVALIALGISSRATKAAESSAQASHDAAGAADALARIETERRHDDLSPDVEISLGRMRDVGSARDWASVYADVTNRGHTDYRCRPVAVSFSGTRQPAPNQEPVQAGRTARIHILDMRVDQDSLPRYVELDFEPDGWDCQCGRTGERHWFRRVESGKAEDVPFTG